MLAGFEKNETAAVANEDMFLNFRAKLDDCMFKVFTWHCKCLLEYYLSIMLCSSCQNCSLCDSLCSNFLLLFFSCFRFSLYQKTF